MEQRGKAKSGKITFWLSQTLLCALVAAVLLPGAGRREAASPAAFLVVVLLAEGAALVTLARRRATAQTLGDRLAVLYAVLLAWEVCTTKLDLLHPVLFPLPENVFAAFPAQWQAMLAGVLSSMQLLLFGLVAGTAAGVLLGLATGWNKRLSALFYPLAGVLAPIPPVVYAPYLVAVMPTFRSASALIVFLGIFFPGFLNSILRVKSMEPRILDAARSLNVRGAAMVLRVLLPYSLPGVVAGLKVTLSTSVMLLVFAEMMGATSGMGYYIINYVHYGNYTNVVAGIVLVGAVVTVLNLLVAFLQKHAVKWAQ